MLSDGRTFRGPTRLGNRGDLLVAQGVNPPVYMSPPEAIPQLAKLEAVPSTNPSMLVNLASTTAANVFQASPRPGVTGVLPISRGGTNAENSVDARANLGFASIGGTNELTCSMANLQETIDSLPKYLRNPTIINVTPGTTISAITIYYFHGPGSLHIRCTNASGDVIDTPNTTTHRCERLSVNYNSNGNVITVVGVTATTTDSTGFYIYRNSSPYVTLQYCNATAGSSSTDTTRGVYAHQSSSRIYASSCTISNKYYATYAVNALLYCDDLRGTGNATCYRSQSSSTLTVATRGTLTGTTIYSTATGGTIDGPNARNIVIRTGTNANSDWVVRQWSDGIVECWRNATVSVTLNNAWANGWMRSAAVGSHTFPVTFTEVPVINRNVHTVEAARTFILVCNSVPTTTSTGNVYVAANAASNATQVNVLISTHVCGRAAL
ncbi:MAG: hypothetical protein FWD27_00720 [Coriobacteriia bacterium]|nr:hypothetical protein [Coriobacteriia bacterium]